MTTPSNAPSPRLPSMPGSPTAPQQRSGGREPQPLPGSWEGILEQAREYAQNGNPEAVPLFEKVINGLGKLSLERRLAKQRRLQDLLLAAVIGLQSFHARRDNFELTLGVVDNAIPLCDPEDRDYLEQHRIGLKFIMGRNDEGLEALRSRSEETAEELIDWSALIWGYIRCDRGHEAVAILDDLAERYHVPRAIVDSQKSDNSEAEADSPPAATEGTATDTQGPEGETDLQAQNESAYLALRGIVLTEIGQVEAGIRSFSRSLVYPDAPYRNSLFLLYSRLANMGYYEEALRFIQRDSGQPARAGFWRGLIYLRQGRREDARAAWRGVAELDQATANRAPTEAILSQFYLGDDSGEILGQLLTAIRETEHLHWTLFMLAAVGFAARGDRDTAVHDFQLAIGMLKAYGEGRKLPVTLWYMVKDLFKAEDVESYARFFEMPLPKPTAP